jgi:hypothetical protein
MAEDEDGQDRLTADEVKALRARLSTFPNFACEICNAEEWHLQPHIMTVTGYGGRGGSLMITGTTYPSALLICGSCGNSKILNLYALGVRKHDEDETPEEPKKAADG